MVTVNCVLCGKQWEAVVAENSKCAKVEVH